MAMDILAWFVVAWAVVVFLGVRWFYRQLTGKRPAKLSAEERYLQGDMTREEYERSSKGS